MKQKMYETRGGEVRITGGIFRGRKITTPGGGTHPMGERERLALFNMISNVVPGAVVLDAYAGSGALGLEALSRGASRVVFVEKNRSAGEVITENLALLGADAEVLIDNAKTFVANEKFDLILVDPPYDLFEIDGVKNLAQFLNNDGLLVLSHPGEAPEIPGLALEKSRVYAGATISIYRKIAHVSV